MQDFDRQPAVTDGTSYHWQNWSHRYAEFLPSITFTDLEKREAGDTDALVGPVCKKSYQASLLQIWKNVKKVAGPLDEATLGDAGQSGLTGMQNSYQASLLQIWKNVKKVAGVPKGIADLVRTRVPPVLIRLNFPTSGWSSRIGKEFDVTRVMPGIYRDWRDGLSS